MPNGEARYPGHQNFHSILKLIGKKMKTRSNENWIRSLNAKGEAKQKALSDLREIILASLPHALSKWIIPIAPRFEPLIQEATQETLLRMMDKLDTFSGRSCFTTWVYTIAVRIALTGLHRARGMEVFLDKLKESFNRGDQPREIPDQDVNVEASAEQNKSLSVSPLTWSHATFVSTLQTFLQENERLNAIKG